ncbi:MAG: cyclic pyranopterin monophosphate synthase MoaC [Fimbriimonas ginsengisoli]|uniref:Cyclic pyranopterin monophosphate synthase MoaC n=1 Tax=Fimbriimonas ginsengisoli TaxID=1005039 RepID=A0A931PVZ0_FIMGI|nr:cyclic pyranopterin monophosphate synthase MoaC [Fimbriimonas ginsengisoli]
MSGASHIAADGSVRMVDVGGKTPSQRVARAEGWVRLLPAHREALSNLPKGDALTTAEIAGIQGGKRCSELVPLCHNVPLSHLAVQVRLEDGGLHVTAEALTTAPTGVEMEAYTAVVVAAVTLIDMLKGVDPDLTIDGVRLVEKSGGKSPWRRSAS